MGQERPNPGVDPETEELIGLKEAAKLMRVHKDTARNHAALGILRASWIGPSGYEHIYTSREAVREWLNPRPVCLPELPPTSTEKKRAQTKAHQNAAALCKRMGA